jgi:hypothetical protein
MTHAATCSLPHVPRATSPALSGVAHLDHCTASPRTFFRRGPLLALEMMFGNGAVGVTAALTAIPVVLLQRHRDAMSPHPVWQRSHAGRAQQQKPMVRTVATVRPSSEATRS